MPRFALAAAGLQLVGYVLVAAAAFATDLRLGIGIVGVALLIEGRDATREVRP